jgi:hypothetical protein
MTPTQPVRRGIESGLVAVTAIMPFHAFLSVWLGHITRHEALIQSWKEVVLLICTVLAFILLARDNPTRDRLRTLPVILIGAYLIASTLVTLITHPSLTAIAFGAKTDFEFFLAFVLSSLIATPKFVGRLTQAILMPACLVVLFGVLEFSVLPANFLTRFGYSSSTIAPYEHLGAAISTLRFPATLGGPNQLGTYLILPFALALVLAWRRRQWIWIPLIIADPLVLLHTYSRGAWVGWGLALLITAIILTPRALRTRTTGIVVFVIVAAAAATEWLLKKGSSIQYYLFHNAKLTHGPNNSDAQHLMSLQTGLVDTLKDPFGHGLGTAGPAVFHSGTGIIIENNYLQVSYESGILGAALFIAAVSSIALELGRRTSRIDLAAACLPALVGISATALFLPAWTDSSTALIFWIAAGASVGLSPDSRHV